jgi:hypothetical protein
VQGLAPQLVGHRLHDLGVTVPDVENAESAQTIQVLATRHVTVRIGPGIRPLDYGRSAIGVGCLAVFEKSGINVVPE